MCFRCGSIYINPEFSENGNQRLYKKHICDFKLPFTNEFKNVIQEATYFEWNDKNKIVKGHYDFAQLSDKQKFIVINKLLHKHKHDIPIFFHACVVGECNKRLTSLTRLTSLNCN